MKLSGGEKYKNWGDLPGKRIVNVYGGPTFEELTIETDEGWIDLESVEFSSGLSVYPDDVGTVFRGSLPVSVLKGQVITRILVPFNQNATFQDAAVQLQFESGLTVRIGSEQLHDPIRIS
jgi:hypothetical protein